MLRHGWLRALLLLLLGLGLAHAACSRAPTPERPWSVQLHLHGSFSEGEGSIDSHSHEARGVGCDVLWWSDHDFRVTTYEHVTRLGFEDWKEPLDRGEAWRTQLRKYDGDEKGLALVARSPQGTADFVTEPVSEGEHSLRLATRTDGPRWEPVDVVLTAQRKLQRRSLATGVTLRLALFVEALAGDARVIVEVQLSEHAPRNGLELGPRVLRYEISAAPAEPERRGPRHVVPLRAEVGRWQELELPLSADTVRGFPESPGEDNVLYQLVLGVDARGGGAVAACFDDLRIEQRIAGAPVYARQRELIDEVGALYPELTELQGLEVSYEGRHLNLFCEDTPLPDYAALAHDCPRDAADPALLDQQAFRARVTDWAVAETHVRGGLVSYNHPFGASMEESEKPRTNEEQLAILLRNRAEGADLLEVGYRDRGGATLDDHLFLWDHAALAGLRLVGTGVSDSHGGKAERWRGQANDMVSWVYAPAPTKRDLIAGLRAGRVFFGDLEHFDGALDLVLDSGERMGATVTTTAGTARVELIASGTRAGERLVVVESGERTRSYTVEGPEFRTTHVLALPPGAPAFVRVELHDESGPIALSNPIHFLRP